MWYGAKLIFVSTIEGHSANEAALREASIRLIEADSQQEALSKAITLGQASEISYLNDRGETVSWRYVEVADVQDLCEAEVTDGMEVYSTLDRK